MGLPSLCGKGGTGIPRIARVYLSAIGRSPHRLNFRGGTTQRCPLHHSVFVKNPEAKAGAQSF